MMTMIPYRTAMSARPYDAFADNFFRSLFGNTQNESFRVDVQDKGDAYVIEADLPGVARENIHVDLNEDVLTISAEKAENAEEKENGYIMRERRTGKASRSFNVEGIRKEDISAAYENGVLTLTLPKQVEAPKDTHRRIEIA